MAYKNNLKESLMSEKIVDSWAGQSFKLSYEYFETEVELEDKKVKEKLKSNLKYMSEQNIRDYISSKYIEEDEIEIENLIKDLIIFKLYKCKVETSINDSNYILSVGGLFFAIYALLLSLNDDFSEVGLTTLTIFLFALLFFVTYRFFKDSSKNNKLKIYRNAISILEAIKEDVYAQSE
ncbi:MAG: hypothetical protein E7A44_02365 [Peptoniphilus harei]|nr:hypothetical protein [Peptoniphilus harei]MDU5467358.1 hypothetical protein [Peptoniphilus harei]